MKKNIKLYAKKLCFFFVIAGICMLLSLFILKAYIYPKKYFSVIAKEASSNQIDPYLVLAIIKTESNFNTLATSTKEAKGLMQLMDTTANELNANFNLIKDTRILNLYDENINIKLGCKYLSNLIQKYEGNYFLAVCAYNAGLGNVDKWIEQGIITKNLDTYKNVELPFKETSNYLKKVISSYKMYRNLYK